MPETKLVDAELEQTLLAEIMLDARILEDDRILDDLFTYGLSRSLYALIRRVHAQGRPVDSSEIALLADSPELRVYAAQVAGLTFSAASVGYHLAELCRYRDLRRLADTARHITDSIQDGLAPEEIADSAGRSLSAVGGNAGAGYSGMTETIPGFIADLEARYRRKGALSGIETGYSTLNTMTDGWQTGEMIVIGARPSVGKTALALNFAMHALKAGKRVGFFSCEMGKNQITARLISCRTRIDMPRIRSGLLSKSDYSEMTQAMTRLQTAPLFIDDTPNIGLDALRSGARTMKRREKIDILFIDYLGLVTHPDRRMQRWEQIGEISRTLKGLARELCIPVIALSQLTRDSEGKEPTLSNLRDSGSIEQDADVIGFLHTATREGPDPLPVDLIIAKNRNGSVGRVHLNFYRQYQRFTERE